MLIYGSSLLLVLEYVDPYGALVDTRLLPRSRMEGNC
jgi:hypothetical protein